MRSIIRPVLHSSAIEVEGSCFDTMMAHHMAVANGTLLGPDEIEGPLGAGGMGKCIAHGTSGWAHVAVKVLPVTFVGALGRRLQRFEVRHPGCH